MNNVIVVGAALQAGTAPRSKENTKGYVRGYDVRSGKRLWTFHTIPHPGEFGNDTWLNDSWAYTGNTAVWSPFSADEELGYVYLPVESPTGDFYGGHRPGNNLFAGSLVCLDAKTGKRVWHQQLVHHDIWDYDIASPPNLINITVNGKPIRAVAQVTKQSYLFVFDRVTGAPVWPIEERQGSGGRHAGRMVFADAAASDQACAVRSAGRAGKGSDRFHARAERARRAKSSSSTEAARCLRRRACAPTTVLGTLQLPGNQGSALWQGAAWDPETNMLYVPSVSNMTVQALQPGGTRSDMTYIGGAGGGGEAAQGGRAGGPGAAAPAVAVPRARLRRPVRRAQARLVPVVRRMRRRLAHAAAAVAAVAEAAAAAARGASATSPDAAIRSRSGAAHLGPGVSRGPWGLGPQGLPLVKPPYGRITAYNMNTGDIVVAGRQRRDLRLDQESSGAEGR